jgi:hypothetical protein
VGLGPELLILIFIRVRNLLDGRPTEDSVVTNERSDIPVSDSVTNGSVDQIGKESDSVRDLAITAIERLGIFLPVLKICVHNLHDTRGELHNANFRGRLHF